MADERSQRNGTVYNSARGRFVTRVSPQQVRGARLRVLWAETHGSPVPERAARIAAVRLPEDGAASLA